MYDPELLQQLSLDIAQTPAHMYMHMAAQAVDMLYIHTKSQPTTNNQQHDEHERDQDQNQILILLRLLRLPLHINVGWEPEIWVGSVHEV